MNCAANCFLLFPSNCVDDMVIFGRNSEDESLIDEAQEIEFYQASEVLEGKTEFIADAQTYSIILQKPKSGIWGGECGVNQCNVCVAITWQDGIESDLNTFDIVRLTVATSQTAEMAVECVGDLVTRHSSKDCKSNLIICDPNSAWMVSCAGMLWAAKRLPKESVNLPMNGMSVMTTIDKCSTDLGNKLTSLGYWNGQGNLNFAACFNCLAAPVQEWQISEPIGDGSYALLNMFETLRNVANPTTSRASNVFVLRSKGISSHWFTATPNAKESVFKPFVFSPQPKISPLTKVLHIGDVTLLHKLHAQRKTVSISHLLNMEAACVVEVLEYLVSNPVANNELDELMKDCVEAEVKFYR